MKKQLLFGLFSITLISSIFYSCTKDVGVNPLLEKKLPYTDKSLLDSCNNSLAFTYYKNMPTTQYPGTTSQHGPFKLKFNKIAFAALTDNDKLPVSGIFPEGSMVVKETVSGKFAFLYKLNGSWLWGETTMDGSSVSQSVDSDPSAMCVSCHNFGPKRDYVKFFDVY